jgi:hypothetical protein
MNHIKDCVVKTVNIIHANALNQHKFVELLEETESEHNKIIHHTNVSWFKSMIYLAKIYFLKEIKPFIKRTKIVKN